MAKAQVTITRELVPDDNADASYLDQVGFEERLQDAREGRFGFVGVRAVAEIRIPFGADWITIKISSPGLWGIEDDSGEEYLAEVFAEERATLIEMLQSLYSFEVVEG